MATYPAGANVIPTDKPVFLVAWSVVCLVAVIVIRIYATREKHRRKGPQWVSIVLSAIAFLIWLYALGGPFALLGEFYQPFVGTLLVFSWTLFVPAAYKGD